MGIRNTIGYGLDLSYIGQGSVAGIEITGSLKFWEFLEWLSNCWLLRKFII
jgi:hypothetical protein